MRITIILSVLMIAGVSHAQDATLDPRSVIIKKGDPAPYDGLLLNKDAQIKILTEKQFAVKECEMKSSYELVKQKAVSDLEIGKLKLDVDFSNKKFEQIMSIKDEELKRVNALALENAKSDKYKWLYLFGGVVVGAALTVGISYAVNH